MLSRNRVLAVDDNATNLCLIEEALRGRFNLRLVDNGKEALQIAPTFLPDVVLLDVMMPAPDGYEVCARLKSDESLGFSQVIMLSAKTEKDERLQGYQAGADDYMGKPFEEEELFAKVAAAVQKNSLYRGVQDEMEVLCGATGHALEVISLLRNEETGEHIERMRVYSQLLAGELRAGPFANQIDNLFLDNLYRASPLHDIGKIAIPDSILCKPGPLTDDERQCMQCHTAIGQSILNQLAQQQSGTSYFRMASEIARWHHECFDGSGYPDGLSGKNIPLAARIVRVADVFDALTSERVYKPKYHPSDAREQIVRGSRIEFDPVVVDALLRVYDEFESACLREDHVVSPKHETLQAILNMA